MKPKDPKPSAPKISAETLAAQALGRVDQQTGALVPPLVASTTYERDADGGYRTGRGYTRPHNPTYDEPEALLTALEDGTDSLLFSSGMAAATAVFQTLLPGDHVLVARVMYWALRTWLTDFAVSWGLDVEFVDTTQPAQVEAAIRPGQTRLLWLETPANPTWEISDIAALSVIAHAAGVKVVVDSTVATPVLTRPLTLGADLVVHSASKYLNGHSDVLAGAVVTAADDGGWQRLRAWRRDAGAMLGPFEAWLLLRGMRTLYVRMARASDTALRLARHFQDHPQIESVLYPGLAAHDGHDVAKRQMEGGFGGMLSIRCRGGEQGAMAVAASLQLFKRATSLGGVESLVEHRASIEGEASPTPVDLLRISVGLEHPEDLIEDLEQALGSVSGVVSMPGSGRVAPTPEMNVTASRRNAVVALIEQKIAPLLAGRGARLDDVSLQNGKFSLCVSGSPGGVTPLKGRIDALVKHHLPDIEHVAINFGIDEADAGGVQRPVNLSDNELTTAVTRILDNQINPMVAAHGGQVALFDLTEGVARIRFLERCQGCALAHLTFRQGVEAILLDELPALRRVEDVTDHAAGKNPYYRTRKGPA